MRKIFIVIILSVGCLMLIGKDFASAAEMPYKELSNEVMLDIFNSIMNVKNKFPELNDFGQHNLFKNSYDIYFIQYVSQKQRSPRNPPFQFALTIIPSDEDISFSLGKGQFDSEFPLLGIKFDGFQIDNNRFNKFHITSYVKRFSEVLLREQNKKMPIFLDMKPTKESFNVGEKISFEVSLTNNTDNSILVRELNTVSLFLRYRNVIWGKEQVSADAIKKVQTKVIEPKESLSKIFTGNAYYEPQEFSICGLYRMTFEGVNPSMCTNITVK